MLGGRCRNFHMLKTKKKTLKIEAETYPGVREWGRGKCFQVTLLLEKCIISMWLMCLCELEPPPALEIPSVPFAVPNQSDASSCESFGGEP